MNINTDLATGGLDSGKGVPAINSGSPTKNKKNVGFEKDVKTKR